jgi:hypothetical protein
VAVTGGAVDHPDPPPTYDAAAAAVDDGDFF